jgi:Fur family ferric uptake transcriptional regulator
MDKETFRGILRQRGLRYTMEREAILEEVLGRVGHFDPEQLHMDLRGKGHRLSRASIYRTLPLLLELGVIEQVERTDRHAHYERTRGHHDHMLCVSCGRVIEFYSGPLERLQDKICREESFQGVSHTLEIRGFCRACRKKGHGRKPGRSD